MRVFFAGAEYQDLVARMDRAHATGRAVAFRRVMERPGVDYFTAENTYLLHPGRTEDLDDEAFDLFIHKYSQLVDEQPFAVILEVNDPNPQRRARAWDLLSGDHTPERFHRVWDISHDTPDRIPALAAHGNLAVLGGSAFVKSSAALSAVQALGAAGARIHIHMVTYVDRILRVHPDSVTTSSWALPLRGGDFVARDGAVIKRYTPPVTATDLVRLQAFAAQQGLNADRIADYQADELMQLALRSYQYWDDRPSVAEHISAIDVANSVIVVGNTVPVEPPEEPEPDPSDVDSTEVVARKETDDASEEPLRTLLPVLDIEEVTRQVSNEFGAMEEQTLSEVRSTEASMRRCDTCALSATCPAYTPSSACAFKLPVDLSTPEQKQALMDTLLEMQTARVAFSRYAEEVQGGLPSKETSAEIDRLVKMLMSKQKLDSQTESLTVSVEHTKPSGLLSAFFGRQDAIEG